MGENKGSHTFPVPLLNRWVPVYDILKCKNFLIGVLDELGNFKQKEVYISKCKSFLNFTAMNPNHFCLLILLTLDPLITSQIMP